MSLSRAGFTGAKNPTIAEIIAVNIFNVLFLLLGSLQ